MSKEQPPNATLSHYRILSKIGEGGMGEVYLAQDIKLDRKVALKILPSEFAKDKERMNRFVREAKSASALNHPNILTIYEIDETESGHFIATEYIVGETLRDRARRVPITLGEALDIAVQTASALAAAHNAGIIHRDIKPENVMVREDGLVKVLDFGLAKLTVGGVSDSEGETRVHSETQPGMIMGTVAYMSPQQARGQVVDRRTDVWSLGVVLYEMLSGRQPFRGETATDTLANILQREPDPLNIAALPSDLCVIVGKMLTKDLDARYSTVADVVSELKSLQKRIEFEAQLQRTPLPEAQTQMIQSAERLSERPVDSGAARAEEGFWVAVLPFKHRGVSSELEALAEGLSEEIVTGLSRFSYLKVIARSSTLGFTEATDIRSVGKQLGARYVMEGSLRQSGQMLRVAVQLVETSTGAHIWAETYNRTFSPESVFELQDDLVPRIVSTVADRYGALVHSMSESVRGSSARQYSPHEAMLRGFGFHERVTLQEHAEVREILEAAVAEAPDHSNCNSMLASLYWHEFSNGFNTRPDPLGRALAAARQAVAAAPANNLAHYSLATALFFKKDFSAFRPAAERAIALNPMDASSTAFLGILISYSGDWESGRRVTERAMRLNPHHPSWYYFGAFYGAYRQRDYRGALDVALKVNMPDYLHTYASLAAAYGQLGELERARAALHELLAVVPDYGSRVRELLGHWFDTDMVEDLIEGLRKAGLEIKSDEGASVHSAAHSISAGTRADEGFWVAVLPFKSRSTNLEVTTLAEGLTEEIVTGLSRFSYLRVIARSSTMRYAGQDADVRSVGKELGARYVMEGNLRQAGTKLRLTVQLVDAITGVHLWAENYERIFNPEATFELQDDLVPRIVSTVADVYGVLPHSMSQVVRTKPTEQLTPYEALLRSFGYIERVTAEEHVEAKEALERAVQQAPGDSDCWAMLSILHTDEYIHGFSSKADLLGQALTCARRSVDANSLNHRAYQALAWAHCYRKEFAECKHAAERTVALNPMDASAMAYVGQTIAYSGGWERGCELLQQAMQLNPNHPGWYRYALFLNAYRQGDYQGALDVALKMNMPGVSLMYVALAAAYGQLNELQSGREAIRELLTLRPNFRVAARTELEKLWQTELANRLIDGLNKAGLDSTETETSASLSNQSLRTISGSSSQSVVVLPFTNISADQENEYFSDGLTEELISDLSKVRSLRVISRSSAMRLKGTTKDLKTIATELNVRYVLDGSVRKAGQNLRISVQLIDGMSDENLWSEKYNGTLSDIFEMQENVSRSIVDALKITLSADEERQLAERPIADAEAYDIYLQARAQFLQGVPAALDRSIELLKQGLEIIGENELLYAALGYSNYVYFRWISKLDENRIRRASECMEKTFALNPSSSHGFVLKGLLSYSEGNMAEAIRSLKKALDLQPNNTEALFWLAVDSSHVGANEAAMKYADQLLTLDPLPPINTVIKGVVCIYKGEFSQALPWVERGLAMDPSSPLLIWTAAIVDAWAGRPDEAIAHVDKLAQIAPDWVYTQHGLFLKHALRGEKELALQYDTAELTLEAEHDCHFALHLAHCFALVHEKDKALDFLELAVRTGMVNHPFLNSFDPLLENIRQEERFKLLMAETKKLSEAINGAQ